VFAQVFLVIIIILFLGGTSSMLCSILLEKDNIPASVPPLRAKAKTNTLEDIALYYDDIEAGDFITDE